MRSKPTGKATAAAFAAFAAVMAAMTIAATRFHDTYGTGILNLLGARNSADMRTGGYSADTAYTWLAAFGADGRRDHLLILLLDLPLIAAFLAFTVTALRWSLPRAGRRLRIGLQAVPFGAAAANLVEDLGVAVLLLSHPARQDGLATATSVVNGLKSALYSTAVLLTVAAVLLHAVAVLSGRCRKPAGPAL